MPNNNYRRGADYEREIVKGAREDGYVAFRSAGSHSPIDVCIVDEVHDVVYLIQCKTGKKSQKKLRAGFDKRKIMKVIWKVMEKDVDEQAIEEDDRFESS